MPGPPPKPSAMRDLGPRLHRKKNKKEPKLDPNLPTCPGWLDEIGEYFFKEVGAMLVEMRVMTDADKKALELLSDAYSEYRANRAVTLKSGSTYESYKVDKDGNSVLTMTRPRPEVQIAQNAWDRVFKGLKEFGLMPAQRTRVEKIGEKKKDPLKEFQDKGSRIGLVKKGGGK